jgi:sugar phosphate isomerase/epimerase
MHALPRGDRLIFRRTIMELKGDASLLTAFPPLPRVTEPHSFRLGVTSYVHPADILPNVEAVAPFVDDIELVFFDSGEHSNLPSAQDVLTLRDLAAAHDLTYTVHFPIDKALGSPSPAEREALLTQMLRIGDLCRPLQPHGWLLHVEGITPDAPPERVHEWQRDALPLLDRLNRHLGDSRRVCLENLGYPFSWCDPFLAQFPFSICLDAGHLWQGGFDWRDHVARTLPRTRVIHLYGTTEGSRHFSLTVSPAQLVRAFLASIGDYSGVLTLETFGYDDTRSSLERLSECLSLNP